jgi:hypothetical protein
MGIEGRRELDREIAKNMDLDADRLFPEEDMLKPFPQEQKGVAPLPGGQTLDQAGNPAQGQGMADRTMPTGGG